MKKIAVQGIAGSFHEDAALKYFNEPVEVVECKTFTSVCELIDSDKVDYAVMAIENSIAGSLLKNYQHQFLMADRQIDFEYFALSPFVFSLNFCFN